MEHPSGRNDTANEGVLFLVSMYQGHLSSTVFFCIIAKRLCLELDWVLEFLEILLTEIEKHILIS